MLICAPMSVILPQESEQIIAELEKVLKAGMIFVNDSEVAIPGGNYWKGLGASYLSTSSSDSRFDLMYEQKILWQKDPKTARPYWFTG